MFLDAKRYQYLWRQQLCANNDHLPFRFFKFYYFLVSISQHDCHFGRFWGSELWCVPPPPADQVACNSQPASSDNQEPNIRCHRPRSGRFLIPFFFIFILFIFSIVVDPSSAMTTPAHNSKLHLKADSAQYFVWIIVLEACLVTTSESD